MRGSVQVMQGGRREVRDGRSRTYSPILKREIVEGSRATRWSRGGLTLIGIERKVRDGS